jgi:peroxiredoxin
MILASINRHRTSLFILILVLGLVWIALSAEGQVFPSSNPVPRRGFLAPDFELVNLNGDTVRLADYHGRPVILNYWASWCPPCRGEMPTFQKIYAQYESQGLVVLAVNSQESRSIAAGFSQSQNLTFITLLDEDGAVSNRYQVDSLPTTFFINKTGYISDVVYGGPITEAYLQIQVDKLLKEMP